jgi:hypothetical protein
VEDDKIADVGWASRLIDDIRAFGPELVTEAMVRTADLTDGRRYSKQALALLKWRGMADWALPRALSVNPDELVLLDGVYHRAWVCELQGVIIDGHIQGAAGCRVCDK